MSNVAGRLLQFFLARYELPEDLARLIYWITHRKAVAELADQEWIVENLRKRAEQGEPITDAYLDAKRHLQQLEEGVFFQLGTQFDFVLSRVDFRGRGLFPVPLHRLVAMTKAEYFAFGERTSGVLNISEDADLPKEVQQYEGNYRRRFVTGELGTFLDYTFNFGIPTKTRFEHMHVLGATGSGKTQLLQRLIAEDLKEQATVIVMAPKGTMIPTIMGLRDVDPDRYVIIDPVDSVEHPLAINLFDVGQHEIQSKVERESHLNQAVALLNYVFASILDAETTSKQSGFINYCLRLMLHIPGATLLTFREILGEAGISKYIHFVQSLSPIAQDFFLNRFHDKKMYGETKQQILWRLDALLENSTIAGLFTQTQSGLNLRREIEQNKVILIDTSIKHLTATGSSFFGRFWLALITLASQQRDPTQALNPVYVYLDEAHGYLGENIETILEQAREARVSLTLAHQQLDQLAELESSVLTNTSTKVVGSCNAQDARKLAQPLRVDHELLAHQKPLHFHLFVKGTTDTAVPIVVKPGYLEGLPKRSKREIQALRQANRDRYAVREVPQPEPPEPTPIHTETSDDFEDLNKS